jgi:hypothetical protein
VKEPDRLTIDADVLALLGQAGRPRICDRAIMSRCPTVHDVVRSTVLAGQVGDDVHLVASRLAGSAWWND